MPSFKQKEVLAYGTLPISDGYFPSESRMSPTSTTIVISYSRKKSEDRTVCLFPLLINPQCLGAQQSRSLTDF